MKPGLQSYIRKNHLGTPENHQQWLELERRIASETDEYRRSELQIAWLLATLEAEPNDVALLQEMLSIAEKVMPEKVMDLLFHLLSVDPENYDGLMGAATCLYCQGEHNAVIEYSTQAHLVRPDSFQPLFQRALGYQALGLYAQAKQDCQAAIELAPQGQCQELRELLEDLSTDDPFKTVGF